MTCSYLLLSIWVQFGLSEVRWLRGTAKQRNGEITFAFVREGLQFNHWLKLQNAVQPFHVGPTFEQQTLGLLACFFALRASPLPLP